MSPELISSNQRSSGNSGCLPHSEHRFPAPFSLMEGYRKPMLGVWMSTTATQLNLFQIQQPCGYLGLPAISQGIADVNLLFSQLFIAQFLHNRSNVAFLTYSSNPLILGSTNHAQLCKYFLSSSRSSRQLVLFRNTQAYESGLELQHPSGCELLLTVNSVCLVRLHCYV